MTKSDKNKIDDIINLIHNRVSVLRSIQYVINRPEFPRLWESSTDELRAEFRDYVNNFETIAVCEWFMDHADLDLGELTFKELFKRANIRGIKNYSRLSRRELINIVTKFCT
jgi:elongation factor P--beta-lysine ligase